MESYSVEYHFDLIKKLVRDINKIRSLLKIHNKKLIAAQFKSDPFYLYLISEGIHIIKHMCSISNISLMQNSLDHKNKITLTLGPVVCYLDID